MSSSQLPPPLSALLSVDLPTPVKAVAGLAVQAFEDARALPDRLTGLPMAVITAIMQRSLHAQQQYTELVTKGEQLINTLRGPSQDVPEWATFDEDLPDIAPPTVTRRRSENAKTAATDGAARPRADDAVKADPAGSVDAANGTPRQARNRVRPSGIGPGSSFDQQALEDMPIARRRSKKPKTSARADKAPVPGFDAMTLPQIRARLKSFDAAKIEALIAHETGSTNRAPVLNILNTRLASLKPQN